MVEEEEEGEAAVACIAVRSLVAAACGGMALQREDPDAEALEEDTEGAETEAALVGGGTEGTRRSLKDAGPLLGPLHCPPSAEACAGAEAVKGRIGSKE